MLLHTVEHGGGTYIAAHSGGACSAAQCGGTRRQWSVHTPVVRTLLRTAWTCISSPPPRPQGTLPMHLMELSYPLRLGLVSE